MAKRKSQSNSKKSRRVNGSLAALVQAVQAACDPFSAGASSAKFPDGAGGATRTVQLSQHVPVTPDAQGEFAFSMGAGVDASLDLTASITDGAVTWNSADDPEQRSSFDALAHRYRVTSYGISFTPTAPTDLDGGVFYLFNDADRPTGVSESQHDHRVAAKKPWVLVGAPLGSDARAFFDVNSNLLPYWTHIGCVGSGLNTDEVTVGYIKIIMNLEYTPKKGSIAQGLPAAPNPGFFSQLTMSAVDSAYSSLPEGSLDDYMSWPQRIAAQLGSIIGAGLATGGYAAVRYHQNRTQVPLITYPNV